MQSGSRFVKYKHYFLRLGLPLAHGQEICKFDSLAFASGKRGTALSELYIAKSDRLKKAKSVHYGCSQIFFPGREEVHSLIHAHVQYVIYIFPTVSHLQDFRLEPLSATSLADHLHVRHKLHGDSYKSLSLTFGTTSAIRIEREIIGLIAIYLRILLLGKEFTDIIINLKICDSIGAGTSSDRILIDIFHPCDSIQIAFKTAENARLVSGLVQPPEHGGIEYVPHKGRLSGT